MILPAQSSVEDQTKMFVLMHIFNSFIIKVHKVQNSQELLCIAIIIVSECVPLYWWLCEYVVWMNI